jgi:hypothetical protein
MPANNFRIKHGLEVDGSVLITGLTASQIVETNASKTLISVSKGTAYNKNFGSGAGTVTEGNDSRLSNARTPTAHASSHTNGTDDIQAATSSVKGLLTASDWTTFNNKQDALTFGIANTNAVRIDFASVADNDYAKFTSSGLEGRSYAEVKTDLSLNNVDNVSINSWAGSSNITTVGTLSSGSVPWSMISNEPSTYDPSPHAITAHTVSGVTDGQYLRATGTTTFAFESITTADVPENAGYLYYTDTRVNANANVSANTSARHTQNTDTGTTAATFAIDSGGTGLKLKNVAGELQVRNLADAAYGNLRVANLTVTGTTTTVNSETVSIADNVLVLNSNESGTPSEDGGIEIERGTSTNAALTWDETSDVWKAGLAGAETAIVLTGDARLTNARTPTSHASTHTNGTDDIQSATGSQKGLLTSADWTTFNNKQNALTFGIANTNAVRIDDTDAASTDYARFTATGLQGRSATEVKTDLSLNNVDNVSINSWTGSGNIVTIGTLTSGTVPWARLSNVPSTFTPAAHVLDSASHTISGKTAGQVLLATAATTFGFTTLSGDITITNGTGATAIGSGKIKESNLQAVGGGTLSGGGAGNVLQWGTGGTFQWGTAADPSQVAYTYGESNSFRQESVGTSAVVVDSFTKAVSRSAEWLISAYDVTNSRYETLKIYAVHDGTNVYYNEFGNVHTSTSPGLTFEVVVNGADIELKATGASVNNTITGIRNLIDV